MLEEQKGVDTATPVNVESTKGDEKIKPPEEEVKDPPVPEELELVHSEMLILHEGQGMFCTSPFASNMMVKFADPANNPSLVVDEVEGTHIPNVQGLIVMASRGAEHEQFAQTTDFREGLRLIKKSQLHGIKCKAYTKVGSDLSAVNAGLTAFVSMANLAEVQKQAAKVKADQEIDAAKEAAAAAAAKEAAANEAIKKAIEMLQERLTQ